MVKRILVLVSFISAVHLNAQTGIGTIAPNASAKLDVFSDNKGFLPPRVSLTGVTDATTIPSPATGLLVYCKGDAGLAAGYYYWNGAAWATIATAGGSGSFAASFLRGSRTAAQSGLTQNSVLVFTQIENVAGTDISLNTSTGKIALSPGNTYRLVAGVPNYYGGRPAFMWYNETTSSYIGNATNTYAPSDAASNGAFGGTASVIITPNVATVLSFRLLSNTNTSASGNGDFPSIGSFPWFEAQVISGNAPVTGQTVDYGIARYTGADTGPLGGTSIVSFDATASGNLVWSGNKFTLKANKTYELESSLAIYQTSGGVAGRFQIYDYTNSVSLANSLFMSQNGGGTNNPSANTPMKAIVTPTTDIQVGVRLLDWYGPAGPGIVGNASTAGSNSATNASYFVVKQIGSSAIVNPWVLSGNDVYNTTGKVGIGASSLASTLTVGNADGTTSGEITLNPQATSNEGGQLNIKRSLTGGTYDWTIDHYGTSNANARLRIFNGSSETNGLAILESGNLGIANITPADKLVIGSSVSIHDGGDKVIGLGWSPGSSKAILAGQPAEIRLEPSSGKLSFGTDPTARSIGATVGLQKRMTITSQGNVGIGTDVPNVKLNVLTSDATSVYIQSNTTDNNGMMVLNANTDQNWGNNWHEFMMFQKQGNTIGFISGGSNGSTVTYGTTSDYRLKKDLKNYSGLDLINRIKTYDYAWKSNNTRMYGVMAHELQLVIPYMVTGEKDAVDAQGKIIPQGVDYSKLTPILVKAVQEQDIKIQKQQKQIDALLKRIKLLERKK